jgi:hypothetical protein
MRIFLVAIRFPMPLKLYYHPFHFPLFPPKLPTNNQNETCTCSLRNNKMPTVCHRVTEFQELSDSSFVVLKLALHVVIQMQKKKR